MPESEADLREYERNIWHKLYGPEPECKEMRKVARLKFVELFPEKHNTSIRWLFEYVAEQSEKEDIFKGSFEHLTDVHPRAWEVILKHGKDYKPLSWRKQRPHDCELQPLSGSCFLNSVEMIYLTRQENPNSVATYVEGFAVGALVDPMLHAWNGKSFSRHAVDWSFYAVSKFTRYFGVPFTFEEYTYMTEKEDGTGFWVMMLFRKDCFEEVEKSQTPSGLLPEHLSSGRISIFIVAIKAP